MTIVEKKEDLENIKEAGRKLAVVMEKVKEAAKPGADSSELDTLAERLIRRSGAKPAFLGYRPKGARRPYPATLCVSVNDEIVHGIPNEEPKILKEGDIVGFDLGLSFRGWFADMAETVPVGRIDKEAGKLLKAAKGALSAGIKAAKVGGRIGDIGEAIESYARPLGYGIVEELGGHGVGRSIHDDPFVPNFGKAGKGEKLISGMVLAIEPMLCEGEKDIYLSPDGYTFKTQDGKRAAQFEHTVIVTKKGGEIITKA